MEARLLFSIDESAFRPNNLNTSLDAHFDFADLNFFRAYILKLYISDDNPLTSSFLRIISIL